MPLLVNAGEITIEWNPPNNRASGDSFNQSEVLSYIIYYSFGESILDNAKRRVVHGSQTSVNIETPAGEGVAIVGVQIVDKSGLKSDLSKLVLIPYSEHVLEVKFNTLCFPDCAMGF